jgi:hypothetical protein
VQLKRAIVASSLAALALAAAAQGIRPGDTVMLAYPRGQLMHRVPQVRMLVAPTSFEVYAHEGETRETPFYRLTNVRWRDWGKARAYAAATAQSCSAGYARGCVALGNARLMAYKHRVCRGEPSYYNALRITLDSDVYTVGLTGFCSD